ncbi:MAG: hypothetical protein JXL97_09140 [Bacteroidales bacterium]|nr:hypothetical protein [Bacteroidales bacterium]
MKKLFLCVLFSLIFNFVAFSQTESVYCKQKIIEDINFLIQDIENIHPESYHSVKKEDVARKTDSIKKLLPDSINIIEAWKIVNFIMAMYEEGHTFCIPPEKEIGNFHRFPFTVIADNEQNNFIVTGSLFKSVEAPLGAEIIRINGISFDSIIAFLKPNVSYETEGFFYFQIAKHFDFAIFSIFGATECFELEMIIDKKKVSKKIKAIDNFEELQKPDYNFLIIQDSIALISIKRLSHIKDFKRFFKRTFKQIKRDKISNLIIDFRGNEGGDSRIGDELIKYISNQPFSQYEKAIGKISEISKAQLKYSGEVGDLLEVKLSKNLTEPYPENKRFSGKVIVLIDAGTFSSGGSTVWCIKHYNLATFVGEETGGTGMHFGYPIKRSLPNTGLRYFVSHIKWYQIGADDNSVHGTIPDYVVMPNAKDIAEGKDTQLNFAIELFNH